ncbi:MAG: hypothetical protein AB7P49_20440, partial [Bdellovibrionales bacterium]
MLQFILVAALTTVAQTDGGFGARVVPTQPTYFSPAPTPTVEYGSGVPIYQSPVEIKSDDETKNGDENKEEEKTEDEGPWRLFPDEFWGFKLTGWVYGTGVYNATNGSSTRYNGPLTMNDQEGVFLNQAWLNLTRPLKETMSWGATFDIFYGNDYLASQSRGWENAKALPFLCAKPLEIGLEIP